jgi:heme-degrading monooxygenase HmoA
VVHLAQLNISKLVAPLDSPQLVDFVANLDRINALAESSPGFVWRLTGDGNDATSLRPFPDPNVIVNMSVWESKEALAAFTYKSDHTAIVRRRREWFVAAEEAMVVLWHVPIGHQPSLEEARERLEHLRTHGPTAFAFTFRD